MNHRSLGYCSHLYMNRGRKNGKPQPPPQQPSAAGLAACGERHLLAYLNMRRVRTLMRRIIADMQKKSFVCEWAVNKLKKKNA
jgi:hypothetical protein